MDYGHQRNEHGPGGGVETSSYNILLAGSGTSEATRQMLADAGFACESIPLDDRLAGIITDRRPTVVLLAADSGPALDMLRQLKARETANQVPVAVVGESGGADARTAFYEAGADDVFKEGAETPELLARLPGLARISTMEAELVRRSATAAEYGVTVPADAVASSADTVFRLLVVGPGTGEFEGVWRELRRSGFELTAETDPYRARTRVEEDQGNRFDGALIYVPDDDIKDRSLYFCKSVRNDRRLFDFPLLLAAEKAVFSDIGEAFSTGASAFAQTPLDGAELAIRLRLLMRVRQRKSKLGGRLALALTPAVADPAGGVYSSNFLQSHLRRLSDKAADRGVASTAILFFVPTIGDVAAQFGEDAAALLRHQVADWLSSLVRVEDMVGRTGPDEFLALLPETSSADAAVVRNRVTGVLHQSEFKLTDNVPTSVEVHLQSGMTGIEPDDTMEAIVQRASKALE